MRLYSNLFVLRQQIHRQRSSGIGKLTAHGATVRIYSEDNLSDALPGIHVHVNASAFSL